jgi:hypothetical protein
MADRLITVRRRHRLAATAALSTESFSYSMKRRVVIDPGLRLATFPDEQPATDECSVAALNLHEKAAFGAYLMTMLGGRMPLISALDLLADRGHTLTLGQLEALAVKTEEGCDTGLSMTPTRGRRLPAETGFFVKTKSTIQLGGVRLMDGEWRISRLCPLEHYWEECVDMPILFVANLRHPL